MRTRLVDIDDASDRLAAGEQPYAFETSDRSIVAGPACGYGAEYLKYLRTQGRYAESVEEASQMAGQRGVTLTGIWFVNEGRRTEATE
jgi:hypothetical protein